MDTCLSYCPLHFVSISAMISSKRLTKCLDLHQFTLVLISNHWCQCCERRIWFILIRVLRSNFLFFPPDPAFFPDLIIKLKLRKYNQGYRYVSMFLNRLHIMSSVHGWERKKNQNFFVNSINIYSDTVLISSRMKEHTKAETYPVHILYLSFKRGGSMA